MTEAKLTDEQAEAMLRQLSAHFGGPVMPIRRYCDALESWGHCIEERWRRLEKELLPNLREWKGGGWSEEAKTQQAEYDESKKPLTSLAGDTARWRQLQQLAAFEHAAVAVQDIRLAIHKSNLLARLLYNGEKLRTQMCPVHKGVWSGIEHSGNICPHRCQLTGWVQEEDDQGKPLPGVFAVTMVPTGEKDEVVVVRSVDGQELGKAVVKELKK